MSKWKELHNEAPAQPEPEEPAGMDAVEQGFEEQLDEALVAFKQKRETENKRFGDVTDCGYYFTVCFTSRAQMDEFCDTFGLDKDLRYHDGRQLSRTLGKALRTADPGIPKEKGRNKDYAARAMKPIATH